MIDTSNPVAVERAQRQKRTAANQRQADLREILATQAGRRLFWKLMEECRVLSSVWDPGALIHYNAGRQALGQALLKEILALDPNIFLTMMNEAQAKEGHADG